MKDQDFDVIIIGTGGGTKLRPASALGKKVAVIEKDDLGGTCLNRGCIPSKMLIYPADTLSHLKEMEKFGVKFNGDFTVDWRSLVERVTATVAHDSASIEPMYEKDPNVTLFKGHGRFVENKVVEVNGERLRGEKIYIATGSRPTIPDIPGLAGTPYMTSAEALRRLDMPKSLIVIGGGYIAVELGHFYSAMGVETDFVVRSGMLKAEDKDIRAEFERDFTAKHRVHMPAQMISVAYDGEFTVTIEADGERKILKAEALLVAVGVTPNSDDLGLDKTDIRVNKDGFIAVDDYLETGVDGVYALGDVIGRYLFRHSVNFEGEYLFNQHFKGAARSPIVYSPVPHAVFSMPQVAGVGVTEDELLTEGQEEGVDYIVAKHAYKDSGMGMAMLPDVGMVKLIFEKSTRKLIGAHIVGEKASDIVHMLILAMTMGARIEDLLKMIYIHPALAEVVRNAVRKANI